MASAERRAATQTSKSVAALLAEAAQAAAAAGAGALGVGELGSYLTDYYRLVAAEDLLPYQAAAVGGIATEHARLAAQRPQGRALVQVRMAGQSTSLDQTRGVVDIVTDDMPFLVDSITLELSRHDLDSYHIIHPQLLVRRDVSGELWEVVGPPVDGHRGHDEIAESWMHIEVDTTGVDLDQLEKDLQRVLADVRVAVEDYPKMQGTALLLADRLAAEGPAAPTETQALLRWLADNHFTFLGYREYDLVEGPDGMALIAVPGTGLGILRHDKRGSSSFAALPPEVRARAKDPQRLILTKANSRSTVHRPVYLDYIAIKRVDQAGQVDGEYRFLGLYTHAAYHESITRIPVLRRKLAGVLEQAGVTADSHDGQDLTEILEGYPREELFQISVEELTPIALGVLRLRTHRQTRLFLRKDVYGRFMSCMVYLPRDRYTTPVRLRTQEILRRRCTGCRSSTAPRSGIRRWPGCMWWCGREPGTSLPEVDPAALEAAVAAAAALGRRPGRRGHPQAGRGPGPGTARAVRRRDPGDLQDRRARRERGHRPPADTAVAGRRPEHRVRPVGGRELHRRAPGHRPVQARGLAAHHLPDRDPDHAHRRAAPPSAHGRGGGGRAPLRVRRAGGAAVLDL